MSKIPKIGNYVKIVKETECGSFNINKKYKVMDNDYNSIQTLGLKDNNGNFIWVNNDEWEKISKYEDLKRSLL